MLLKGNILKSNVVFALHRRSVHFINAVSLTHRKLIAIRGSDAIPFLQGLVTNDVRYFEVSDNADWIRIFEAFTSGWFYLTEAKARSTYHKHSINRLPFTWGVLYTKSCHRQFSSLPIIIWHAMIKHDWTCYNWFQYLNCLKKWPVRIDARKLILIFNCVYEWDSRRYRSA